MEKFYINSHYSQFIVTNNIICVYTVFC